MLRNACKTLSCIIVLIAGQGLPSVSDAQGLPLWQVDGAFNTVYLLGSIHLLREPDYPLADRIYEAYEDADSLIMELDMDDLDDSGLPSLVARLGALPVGSSLEDVLGADDFVAAEELAAAADLDIQQFLGVKPWLAAITIEQLILQRIGFDPELGVEAHFLRLSAADDKEITGLETIEQQLGILDGLSLDAQRSLLLETLKVAPDIRKAMNDLVDAWQQGDAEFLEANLLADMRSLPEVHRAVVLERNRRWAADLLERLEDRENYLVIVGTLHLIGDEGLPALLEENGYSVRQFSR